MPWTSPKQAYSVQAEQVESFETSSKQVAHFVFVGTVACIKIDYFFTEALKKQTYRFT